LFIHPQYSPYDTDIEFNEINKLAECLSTDYNCKLLAIVFNKSMQERNSWHIIHNDERLIYININNSSTLYHSNKSTLNEIFEHLGVEKKSLMSYDDFAHLNNYPEKSTISVVGSECTYFPYGSN
jgi:hypothetical protein